MNSFSFDANLSRLRKEFHLTQQQVADHVCVTKASVSKWENGQALPDLQILVRLAALFNVSLDELLGYSSSLSRKQIDERYERWCRMFAFLPFETVFEDIQNTLRDYWHDWPLLLEVSTLLINHLPDDAAERTLAADCVSQLCIRIRNGCSDRILCERARQNQAVCALITRNPQETVDLLESDSGLQPLTFLSSGLLIQALVQTGQPEKARSLSVQNLFLSIQEIIRQCLFLMTLQSDSRQTEQVILLARFLIENTDFKKADPNLTFNFLYTQILRSLDQGDLDAAKHDFKELFETVVLLKKMMDKEPWEDGLFHFAPFFSEELSTTDHLPRDPQLVWKDLKALLSIPELSLLQDLPEYSKIMQFLDSCLHFPVSG